MRVGFPHTDLFALRYCCTYAVLLNYIFVSYLCLNYIILEAALCPSLINEVGRETQIFVSCI